jgi:hypothetical protein
MKTPPKLRSFALMGAALLAGAAPVLNAADYQSTLLSHNPLAYWRLDTTTAAPPLNKVANSGSLGSAGDGYAVLDVNKGQTGVVGNCIRLNNVSSTIAHCGSKVDVPFNAALNPSTFSVEFWAKPNTLPASDTTGVCPLSSFNQNWFGGANRSGFLFYVNNQARWNFRLGLTSGYAVNLQASTGTASVGNWQHIVATYDGLTANIYANGVLIASAASDASTTGWRPNSQSALRIGGTSLNGDLSDNPSPGVFNASGQGHSGNRGWDGWVDEVAVYNSILSPSTVAAHYAAATTNNAGYSAQILASSPVGYWNMNETAVTAPDPSTFPIIANAGSLGTAADGTNLWGALTAQTGSGYGGLGAGNKAVYFDGENGSIALPDAAGLHFSGNITMMAWVKPTVQDFYRDIIAHGWDDGHAETFLRISRGVGGDGAGDGNYYEVGVTDNSGYYDAVLFPIPPADIGNWVFLAGTYDGSSWNLYRNGVLAGSVPSINGALDVTNRWSIGSRSDPSDAEGLRFGGYIDEPAIFSSALSAGDIAALYAAAQPAPVITRAVALPPGLFKGASASFNVWAEGSPTLTYSWTSNGVAIGGSTTNITLNSLAAGSLTVQVVAANAYGSATSAVSTVIVASKPLITQQPIPVTRYLGLQFQFSIAASGTTPIAYQWKTNGVDIPGATSATYSGTVSAATAGNYNCLLSNEAGTSNSITVALTALAIPAGYGSAIVTNVVRPVAYWRLGEASGAVAHDYIGGFDGTYFLATLGLPGYSVIDPDTAAGFGAVNNYVGNINGTAITFPGTNSTFTLEAWVNGPDGQGDESTIIAKGNGSSGTTATEQFALDVAGGKFRFFTRGGGNSFFEADASVGPNGTWQHVVCVYDSPGGQMTIYVNGEVVGNGSPRPSGVRVSSSPISIGSKHLGNSPEYDGYFTGTIDEVAIYPYVMSASTVLAHYSAAYGPSLAPSIVLQPKSLTNYVSLKAAFSVGVGGTVPLQYQWKKDGADIPDATTHTYTIPSLVLGDAGNYSVRISNVNGVTNSAIATLTVLSAPSVAPAIPGLALHLPFDNNLTDVSGHGNNGVGIHITQNQGIITSNSVAPTFVADGALGQGLHFATSQSDSTGTNWDNFYATLGDRVDLHFSSNINFTISYWARAQPANYTFGDLPFLCTGIGSTFAAPGLVFAWTYGYGATPYPGGWAFSMYDVNGNGVGGRGEIGSIDDGSWHHLVHVFDRKNGNLNYLDGIQVKFNKQAGTSSTAAQNIDSGNWFTIGQDPTGLYVEQGYGDIDDLGIWHKALTPLEAASIFMAGSVNHLSFTSAAITLSLNKSGNNVILTWPAGVLQSADEVTGPYVDVPAASSPFSAPATAAKKFYRVRQ